MAVTAATDDDRVCATSLTPPQLPPQLECDSHLHHPHKNDNMSVNIDVSERLRECECTCVGDTNQLVKLTTPQVTNAPNLRPVRVQAKAYEYTQTITRP